MVVHVLVCCIRLCKPQKNVFTFNKDDLVCSEKYWNSLSTWVRLDSLYASSSTTNLAYVATLSDFELRILSLWYRIRRLPTCWVSSKRVKLHKCVVELVLTSQYSTPQWQYWMKGDMMVSRDKKNIIYMAQLLFHNYFSEYIFARVQMTNSETHNICICSQGSFQI